MSSDPVLSIVFDRPLRDARLADADADRPGSVQPAEHSRLAELERSLEVRSEELARREADLAGQEAALNARQKALAARKAELGALIESINAEKAELLESHEQEIIAFSLSIAEKVLQYELENGNYKIGEVVRSTLNAVRKRGQLIVRVNPADADLAREAVEGLGRSNIQAVSDESVPRASCCIETDCGKVYSEIPGRLERIEKSLLKKSGGSP
jgi:flagellar biosynthesis/type III secretory pathway protein FliH